MAPFSSLDQPGITNFEDALSCCHDEAPSQPLSTPFFATISPKKAVTFNNVVAVHKGLHINHYADDEVLSCWYTQEEFNVMREIADVCADRLEIFHQARVPVQDDDVFCWRGLESRTYTGSVKRQNHKASAYNAVLDEQDLQFAEGICDLDYIAYLYKVVSARAAAQARATGLRDYVDALR